MIFSLAGDNDTFYKNFKSTFCICLNDITEPDVPRKNTRFFGSVTSQTRSCISCIISVESKMSFDPPPQIIQKQHMTSQIAKFMGPTGGPTGSWRPQMGLMLAPWTLLLGILFVHRSVNPNDQCMSRMINTIYSLTVGSTITTPFLNEYDYLSMLI